MILKARVAKSTRLKNFLQNHWNISARQLTALKKQPAIFVNGRPRSVIYRLKPGDEVLVRLDTEHNDMPAHPMEFEIIYEDDFLLVVNKPAGCTVHPTKGQAEATLMHGISYRQQQRGQDYKIRLVHRLDHDTSGVLVIAKNKYAHHQLSEQFVARTVERCYWALSHGRCPEHFLIQGKIGQTESFARVFTPQGKTSRTDFSCLEAGSDWSLIEARPKTGRTHQIRLHLQVAGYPIIGDELYGLADGDRHMLHARSITLKHPLHQTTMCFTAELTADMQACLARLRQSERRGEGDGF